MLVLAAAVPACGRILEIGTGAGVGTAWLVEGVRATPDVELVTVDVDEKLVEQVKASDWPAWVQFEIGDALDVVPRLGQFDLVFADAIAGKWYGLDVTIESVRPGGFFVVNDMAPLAWANDEHELRTSEVRTTLLTDTRLAALEIGWASGLILASRLAI